MGLGAVDFGSGKETKKVDSGGSLDCNEKDHVEQWDWVLLTLWFSLPPTVNLVSCSLKQDSNKHKSRTTT